MRYKGLHMEWSHIWSLLNWNEKKITIQMNGWFNIRCDLMAWDGEDSKERLRGTKQGWRASDDLAAEEPS